jgi:hypothetical protein
MQDLIARPVGHVNMRVWRNGVPEEWGARNFVVGGYAQISALLLGGDFAGNSITQIGFGSNSLPPAVGNTGLSLDAYVKDVDSVSYPRTNQVAFQFSLGQFEGNGIVIAEYGLLTGAGTLYSRLVRAKPMTKDSSMSLTATWTITFG